MAILLTAIWVGIMVILGAGIIFWSVQYHKERRPHQFRYELASVSTCFLGYATYYAGMYSLVNQISLYATGTFMAIFFIQGMLLGHVLFACNRGIKLHWIDFL